MSIDSLTGHKSQLATRKQPPSYSGKPLHGLQGDGHWSLTMRTLARLLSDGDIIHSRLEYKLIQGLWKAFVTPR